MILPWTFHDYKDFPLLISTFTKQVEMQTKCLCLEACADAEAMQTSAGWISLLQAHCLLISSLCCLRLQQMPLVSVPVAPHAPLRWGIRAVDSIFPWLPNKADVLLLPSPKSALKLPMMKAAAPHWCTPPLSKAFRFAQSTFLSLGNVGKKTVLSITVNCANWDI